MIDLICAMGCQSRRFYVTGCEVSFRSRDKAMSLPRLKSFVKADSGCRQQQQDCHCREQQLEHPAFSSVGAATQRKLTLVVEKITGGFRRSHQLKLRSLGRLLPVPSLHEIRLQKRGTGRAVVAADNQGVRSTHRGDENRWIMIVGRR